MSERLEVRRNPDESLDEVVATGATVHLEQMDDNAWWLMVSVPSREVRIWFQARGKIRATIE